MEATYKDVATEILHEKIPHRNVEVIYAQKCERIVGIGSPVFKVSASVDYIIFVGEKSDMFAPINEIVAKVEQTPDADFRKAIEKAKSLKTK